MTAKKEVSLITDVKEFNALVASISKRGAKLDADIQLAGLSALQRLAQHGDIGYVNRLYLGLHAGARKSALSAWLLAFGALVANTEEGKAEKPFVYSKDKTTDMAEAHANPWFEFKPDPAPDAVFDVQAALIALLKKAKGKTCTDPTALLKVENLLADLKQGTDTAALPDALV